MPGWPRPGDEEFYIVQGLIRVRDHSAAGVRRSLEESLERSGLDGFDIVVIYDPDDHWPQAVSEAFPESHRLEPQ